MFRRGIYDPANAAFRARQRKLAAPQHQINNIEEVISSGKEKNMHCNRHGGTEEAARHKNIDNRAGNKTGNAGRISVGVVASTG